MLIEHQLDDSNFIIEPTPKNTAPAIALAVAHISNLDTSPIMMIHPSDHYIEDENKYKKLIEEIMPNISKGLFTIAIPPQNPVTGYGYIKTAQSDSRILKVESLF